VDRRGRARNQKKGKNGDRGEGKLTRKAFKGRGKFLERNALYVHSRTAKIRTWGRNGFVRVKAVAIYRDLGEN